MILESISGCGTNFSNRDPLMLYYLSFINNFIYSLFRGPNAAILLGSDLPRVNVTGLTKGEYLFQLTAWDDSGVSGSDNVTILVKQSKFDVSQKNKTSIS